MKPYTDSLLNPLFGSWMTPRDVLLLMAPSIVFLPAPVQKSLPLFLSGDFLAVSSTEGDSQGRQTNLPVLSM